MFVRRWLYAGWRLHAAHQYSLLKNVDYLLNHLLCNCWTQPFVRAKCTLFGAVEVLALKLPQKAIRVIITRAHLVLC